MAGGLALEIFFWPSRGGTDLRPLFLSFPSFFFTLFSILFIFLFLFLGSCSSFLSSTETRRPDIGRDSWDCVGPPAWGRACFNSPEWGGDSSPVKTEPPQIVLLLLLRVAIFTRDVSCQQNTGINSAWEPSMALNSGTTRKSAKYAEKTSKTLHRRHNSHC